jgi:hypothetical protein
MRNQTTVTVTVTTTATNYGSTTTETSCAATIITITTTTATSVGSSSAEAIQGIVTGIVSVRGQIPANISNYSLMFNPVCRGESSCGPTTLVPIYPSGHFTVLLAAGNYTVLGIKPSCNWIGCSTAFPQSVTVEAGQQIVLDIDVG